ncbi:cellulose synthase subunit BcsC-related outer membrane protein [Roseomonas sp. NAR14]|uniref:Cellulose synthase subunit BcsC-related outer membrane protein n=1 Tax=Roseomonas acroporae TaxID=2937791 RepID=A0A9X2BT71_9PROT|nr:cellulose synthase subunit BcsC-related outer membrane protein [Roseomonas acroporae]
MLRIMERVLAADPRNAEALSGAAEAAAQMGNRRAADAYLARLRQAAPGTPRLGQTDITVRALTSDQNEIAEARRLAQAGRTAEAIQRYRAVFRGSAPPDAYALEFYQTLAGTPDGFDEARAALGRLAARSPADTRLRLAYAQVLSYRDATRAEGIAQLRELSRSPDNAVATAALNAWRQATLFAGANQAAIPGLEAFLQAHPDDTAVRQRLQEARNQPANAGDAAGDGRVRGFEQLNRGRLADAAREFESVLALDADDSDALGGLGIVRLRQGRNAEARRLLEQAIAANPASRSRWQQALEGASYVDQLAVARGQIARGQFDAADATLRNAIRRNGPDRADAEALLGDIALRRGDVAGAEERYRAALARRPDLTAALAGLGNALQQQGRFAEAEEILRRAGPAAAAGAARTRADTLRAEAGRTQDPAAAQQLLREAIQADPSSPWARLDLARALLRDGRAAEARAVMDTSGLARPGADALYAAALFAQEDNRAAEAAELLERIPPRLRTADMSRLLAQTRQAGEVRAAFALAAQGLPEGRARLLAIAARPDPTAAGVSQVVRAFGDLGDRNGLAAAVRAYQSANPATPTARLALADALLAAGMPNVALALTAGLDAAPDLTGDQRRSLASLRSGLAIRESDQLNDSGNQAAAFDRLAPALAANPESPAANLALARLYQGAGQPRQAQRVAESVLARDPRSLEARLGAADAAIAAGDTRRAEVLLAEARSLEPDEPRVSLAEARLARSTGDYRRALNAAERAAAQHRQQAGGVVPMDGPMVATPFGAASPPMAPSGNPFRRDGAPAASPGPDAPLGAAQMAVAGDPLAADIARELAQAREDAGTRLSASATIRARSGSAGLDRLTEFSAPLEASFAPGGGIGGRIALRATPTTIDSEEIGTSLNTLRGFGIYPTLPQGITAAQRSALASWVDSSASGVALALAYARPNFSLDIGTTPLGFRRDDMGGGRNIVGGIEAAPALTSNLRLRLTGERRAVTDSLLSWAGQREPVSGLNWGAVSRNGGRAQLELTTGPVTTYIGGGYSAIDGENVRDNAVIQAGAGAAWTVFRRRNDELTAGADLVYFAYDNNQRAFTFGNGGYFSPQQYVAASLPVDYRGRTENLAYRIGGTIGYQHYRERSERIFPTNAAAQNLLEALAAADPTIPTRSASQRQSGLIGGVRGNIEYAVTPNFRLGALVRFDSTGNWNETRGLLFARYRFDR